MVLQSFVFKSTRDTEQHKYTLIKTMEEFEIRFYPRSILATVNMEESTYKNSANRGFRTLAGYIFGSNEKKESIAMTAPVEMRFSDTTSSMSFVMPSKYSMEQLPVPNNKSVKLSYADEEYVAAIRYSGYSSDRDIASYTEKLKSLLEKNNIKYTGPFRYLGYNPPYEIFGRRNEIVVRIEYPQ